MFSMSDRKRIQVPANKALRDYLRDLSAQLSKERDEDISVGGLANELLESLSGRPDLIQVLLTGGVTDAKANGHPLHRKKAPGGLRNAA